MITFAILILIVAKALPGLNTHISSIHVTRITSVIFLFAGILSLNSLNLESIGSGIGIYSGFFQITTISQLIEIFLFMIGGGILVAWPQIKSSATANAYLHKEECSSYSSSYAVGAGSFGAEGEQSYLSTEKYSTDYSLVVLFSSLGSSLLISSYDLISVYLSIELQSFGLYILSTLYRDSESSTKAGLKYFLLGGLSSCIILLGTGIIYSYTGTTNLESLYIINSVIIDINQQYIIQGISLGLSLIFIGFLFKIAAAPLHNWSPDVYDGTPTIVTTWLTIIPKIAILFILLELQIKLGYSPPATATQEELDPSLVFGLLGSSTQLTVEGGILSSAPAEQAVKPGYLLGGVEIKTLLLISATLSLIIGSLLGLAQIKIKRLLAYSTISHLGFILLALAVNTEQSIDSFIFYIIQYTITNLNIFLIILGLTYCLSTYYFPSLATNTLYHPTTANAYLHKEECSSYSSSYAVGAGSFGAEGESCGSFGNKDISLISEFKGLFFSNPLLSISLAVSLFSMAGIPPLIGFFSKQLVLYSALQNGYYFISVLAIIVSVISCSYYLQIIKILLTHSPHNATQLLAKGKKDNYLGSSYLLEGGIESHHIWIKKNGIILTNTHSYLISTLTFTILLFFIKPSLILNSTQLLSLSLFYI